MQMVDNEFDDLNDETFGGNADEWDHDEHEQMLGEFSFNEPESNGHNGHAHAKAHLVNGDGHHGGHHPGQPFPGHHLDESLEDSLGRLVVDDEDELEDPAVMNASKNR